MKIASKIDFISSLHCLLCMTKMFQAPLTYA